MEKDNKVIKNLDIEEKEEVELLDEQEEFFDAETEEKELLDSSEEFFDSVTEEESPKTRKMELPDDITMDELYLINAAIEETYDSYKIQEKDNFKKNIRENIIEMLESTEIDEKLEKLIDLMQEKERVIGSLSEIRDGVDMEIEKVERNICPIINTADSNKRLKKERKRFNELRNDVGNKRIEVFKSGRYNIRMNDKKRVEELVKKMNLIMPKEESFSKKVNRITRKTLRTVWWNLLERHLPSRQADKLNYILKKMVNAPIKILKDAVNFAKRIAKEIPGVDDLFKNRQLKNIKKEKNEIEGLLKRYSDVDELKNLDRELTKLEYKHEIFFKRVDVAERILGKDKELSKIFKENITKNLADIHSKIVKIQSELKNPNNLKKSDVTQEDKENSVELSSEKKKPSYILRTSVLSPEEVYQIKQPSVKEIKNLEHKENVEVKKETSKKKGLER